MTHVIEPAKTGRAKCRGCDRPIAKDELRFGERVANAFGDGETTLWFHLQCAAYKRPEPFLEALEGRADIACASFERAYVYFKHEDEALGPQLAERMLSGTTGAS